MVGEWEGQEVEGKRNVGVEKKKMATGILHLRNRFFVYMTTELFYD